MGEINEKGEHTFRLPDPWEGPRHKAVSRSYLAYRRAIMKACGIDDENDDLSDDALLKRLKELSDYIEKLEGALEPFAMIAELDISDFEADTDLYRPMAARHALAPLLRVGDLRHAYALSLPSRQKTE